MNLPRSALSGIVSLALSMGCVGAPHVEDRELRVRGSDTMLVLNRRLAEEFMRGHPGMSVRVAGGGTGTGVEALLAGEADICAASRPLLAEEVAAIHDRFGSLGVRFLVCQDALSVFVNAANPVRDLSSEQLRAMFDGTIASWSDVGGEGRGVVVIVRPPTSGSHRFFRDHVLKGRPYATGAVTVRATFDVLEAVRDEPGAIGYGGLAYRLEGAPSCAIDGVLPDAEAVRDGRYPLARYLVFYTVEPPVGLAKRFIDWCLGEAGQEIVAEVGYIPLWPG
jgi:phosphate transport system substrate-binding protein